MKKNFFDKNSKKKQKNESNKTCTHLSVCSIFPILFFLEVKYILAFFLGTSKSPFKKLLLFALLFFFHGQAMRVSCILINCSNFGDKN